MPHRILALTFCLISSAVTSCAVADDAASSSSKASASAKKTAIATPKKLPARSEQKPSKKPTKELFTGQVVLLTDALKQRGIPASDEIKGQVVLETPKGELIPIVPDWRGRAFFQDKRLRNRKVELVGSRRKGVPYLQVLMIYVVDKKGKRQYMDYWCDLCSISMYEIKPCDCCQDATRLRFQTKDLPDYVKRTAPAVSKEAAGGNGNNR